MSHYTDAELYGLICCKVDNYSGSVLLGDDHANWYVPVTLATASACSLVSLLIFATHILTNYQKPRRRRRVAPQVVAAPADGNAEVSQDSTHSYDVVSVVAGDSLDVAGDSRHVLPVGIIRIMRNPSLDEEVALRCTETKGILFFVFLCGLLGCLFSVLRSTLWALRVLNTDLSNNNWLAHILCSGSTVLLMTFYTCSLFWTVAYCYDAHRCWTNRPCLSKVYHSLCWSLAVVIGSLSEISIYIPEFKSCPSVTFINIWVYKIIQAVAILVALLCSLVFSSGPDKKAAVTVREDQRCAANRTQLRHQSSLTVFFLWICWLPALVLTVLVFCAYYLPDFANLNQYSAIFLSVVAFLQNVYPVFIALIYTGIMFEQPHSQYSQLPLDLGDDANAAAM